MTPLQLLLAALRTAFIVDPAKVNFGLADNLQPPYAMVETFDYNTNLSTGPKQGLYEGQFGLVIVGKNIDEAETIALAFDNFLNLNNTVIAGDVPSIGVYKTSWQSGQIDPKDLYQSGVRITYNFILDPQ